ncbi:MAG: hypothetical protein ABIJ97_05440 [Bacteroidota bacterium]
MRLFILLLILLFAVNCFPQTVLLEEDVEGDTIIQKNGPNLKRYGHLFLDYGLFADKPEGSGLDIMYGNSSSFGAGYRYKYKITNFLAFGWDLHFSGWTFRIKQNDQKTFPDTILHKRERIGISNWGGEIYIRINYGKRGNQIGKFIDFAGYGNWVRGADHFTLDKLSTPNAVHAKIVRTTYSDLLYIEKYNYGVNFRLGFNRFVMGASYRLSDLILESFNTYPELPRLHIFLQIGIH